MTNEPPQLQTGRLLAELARIARRRKEQDRRERQVVFKLRAQGVSWDKIGVQLGINGEGLRKRHGGQR